MGIQTALKDFNKDKCLSFYIPMITFVILYLKYMLFMLASGSCGGGGDPTKTKTDCLKLLAFMIVFGAVLLSVPYFIFRYTCKIQNRPVANAVVILIAILFYVFRVPIGMIVYLAQDWTVNLLGLDSERDNGSKKAQGQQYY